MNDEVIEKFREDLGVMSSSDSCRIEVALDPILRRTRIKATIRAAMHHRVFPRKMG